MMTNEESVKLIGGMTAGGAGVGLLGVLWDAIRSERRRTEALAGQNKEDGTLEMFLPPGSKQAVAAQIVVGMGGAAGAAYLVQSLYRKWKAEQLKQEIDENAIGYMDDVSKTAGGLDWLTELPRDLAYLAPIAAAGGTYALLEHAFPKVKEKPKPGMPKKITIKGYGPVVVDGPGDGPLAEMDKAEVKHAPVKSASFSFGIDDQKRAAESLCLMVTAVPMLKDASSALPDLLGSYHLDPEALRAITKQAGFLAAVSASRGGADVYYSLNEHEKRAAVRGAIGDDLLSPSIALTALAEFNELQPMYAKVARDIADDDDLSLLYTKLASALHVLDAASTRPGNPDEKQASDWRKEMSTLDVSEAEDSGGDVNAADSAYSDGGDPIDRFMAGKMPAAQKTKRF